MKSLQDQSPFESHSFAGDLNSRLDVVRDRVGAENEHLDQVEAVAQSYMTPLPPVLRLVR
jgi:hypothetical protein